MPLTLKEVDPVREREISNDRFGLISKIMWERKYIWTP